MKAKKSLGQHWLHSVKAIRQIVGAGSIEKNDTVLEIGPGQGVLTEKLLELAETVIAIEMDQDCIEVLKQKFEKEIRSEKLILLQGDVLEFDINELRDNCTSYKLVANIPYYITGAIIEKFASAEFQPTKIVLLIQKEVAVRIVAKEGKESILSIAVKAYSTPKIISHVPAGAFNPPPKIDSSIILLDNVNKESFKEISELRFFETMKAGFAHKRKVLIKNLEVTCTKEAIALAFEKLKMNPKVRAEDLKLADWIKLVKELSII